jgi:hypothetical protein
MIRKDDATLWSKPVWVDFMASASGRVPLDFPGTQKDLEDHKIALQEGIRLTLYTYDATQERDPDDLVCVGSVEWDSAEKRWMAAFDWESLTHVSEMEMKDRELYLGTRS